MKHTLKMDTCYKIARCPYLYSRKFYLLLKLINMATLFRMYYIIC